MLKTGAVLALLLISLAGCATPPPAPPAPWAELQQLDRNQAGAAFVKLPLETQVELFAYGASQHPGAFEYGLELAQEGQAPVPFLLARIKREADASVQLQLLRVVGLMSLLNRKEPAKYPFRPSHDPSLFIELNDVVAAMHDGGIKHASINELSIIFPDGKPAS